MPAHLLQFLIVLRLVPRLHDEKAWTAGDFKVLEDHFLRLQKATEAGQVILAGRTDEPNSQTFGLVVFEAPDESSAQEFMQADPTVAAGLMIGELHAYRVALLRK